MAIYCLIDEEGTERLQLELTDIQLNQLAEYVSALTENNSALDIVAQFNDICVNLPHVYKITPSRRKAITAAQREYNLEDIFKKVAKTPFLNGKNGRGWVADFDWILKPTSLVKIYEGSYGDAADNGNHSFDADDLDELAVRRYNNNG